MRHSIGLVALVPVLVLGCVQPPPPAPPPPAELRRSFSGERAVEDLGTLTAIGERRSGTSGAERARAFLREELEKSGIRVEERVVDLTPASGVDEVDEAETAAPDPEGPEAVFTAGAEGGGPDTAAAASGQDGLAFVQLVGIIPGTLDDIIVIAAPYEAPDDSQSASSGAAMALGLARELAAVPLPYTTWIVFLDGDLKGEDRPAVRIGTRAWMLDLAEEGVLARTRMAVVFGDLCGEDLTIARDLFSHRSYRKEFWAAARRLDHGSIFPDDAPLQSPDSSHKSFFESGVRRVVFVNAAGSEVVEESALVQVAEETEVVEEDDGEEVEVVEEELAGEQSAPPAVCTREGLEAVGNVSLEAIGRVAERLAKVDRLAPSSATPEAAEPPAAGDEPAASPGPDAGPE